MLRARRARPNCDRPGPPCARSRAWTWKTLAGRVEGHRLAVPLEVALRGAEVVERGLDLGEAQLHQPTGGIVDVHQERADGPAVFEPGVLGAVDLDELAETRAARPRRVAPADALQPRQPEPRADQPAAQRLDGQDEAMVLSELWCRG
jgi:hypothetical protein